MEWRNTDWLLPGVRARKQNKGRVLHGESYWANTRIEYYGRDNIQKVTFYEVTENKAEIDIDGLFAEDDAQDVADAKAKEEAKERKILEDLKKKYPDA